MDREKNEETSTAQGGWGGPEGILEGCTKGIRESHGGEKG